MTDSPRTPLDVELYNAGYKSGYAAAEAARLDRDSLCPFCGHSEHLADVCEYDLGESGECRCIDDRYRVMGHVGQVELVDPALYPRTPLEGLYAAQLNLTIRANSTIEDLRKELHAALAEGRRIAHMGAQHTTPEKQAASLRRYNPEIVAALEAEARASLDEPPRIVTLAWDATAEDVASIRRDWEAAAEARAEGLDVERLARALEAAMSGQHVIPPALRSEFGLPPIWEPLAERLAREYAALEEPTDD